jgi:hypothetical protein
VGNLRLCFLFSAPGSRRDYLAVGEDEGVSFDDVKAEWKQLWRCRVDDKVRAEGVADRAFSLLFVERGTVIVATRDFKPLDFKEILRVHRFENVDRLISPHPSVGGWRKFARTVLNRQTRARSNFYLPPFLVRVKDLQLKKGGRGWLHKK